MKFKSNQFKLEKEKASSGATIEGLQKKKVT